MFKMISGGLSLSLLIIGSALAADGVDGGEGAGLAAGQAANVATVAPAGDADSKTPAAGVPFEYKFGVNGFFRVEGTGNFRLADNSYDPKYAEGRYLYRVKPFASWQPTDYLGLHLEGQGYGFVGGGHSDGQLSLYQGYLDGKLPGKETLALRAGRQEFSYGSNFMLGPDSFFNGLSFDAVRLKLQPSDALGIDILGGFYTAPSANGVKGNISGGYGTWTASEGNALEAYYLRDTGSTFRHQGEELDSWGLRATAKVGPLSLELEPVYQSGELFNPVTGGNENINAYGGHADLTADLTLAGLRQRFSLGYALGSGSQAAADGTSAKREFRNPDNDTCLVGDMHVIGDLSGLDLAGHHASGLQIYTLGWGVDLSKELVFTAAGHYFRANAVAAGLSRELGLEADFGLTYTFSENYSLLVAYDRFFTGSFFRGASGSGNDIHYGYAMLQFNLEKAKLKAPGKIVHPG